MDNTNISLRTKSSEVLETLNLIIFLYAIFLMILGIILNNTEMVIQTCIMFVVHMIFEYLNYDITHVNQKGIKNKKYGSIEWGDIYRAERKKNIILLYTKERERPYKLIVDSVEDFQEISRVYKYMLSKIKSPDKLKENIKIDK